MKVGIVKPLLVLAVLIFQGCQPSSNKGEITVVAQEKSNNTSGSLELLTSLDSVVSTNLQLEFKVSDYQLGTVTRSDRSEILANSAKGQHIHLIIDNRPYMAKYQDSFSLELKPGNHTLLAFLSRSYHESIKTFQVYELREFVVGENTGTSSHSILEPSLFFSRPKGDYTIGQDGLTPILLDFYLVNTDLTDGKRIRAIIDNNEFILKEWKPYFIYGLGAGEHRISLELINEDGVRVAGERSFSEIRKFNIKLKEDESSSF